MNKKELKNGAVVVTRNKMVWLKIDNTLLSLAMSGVFITLDGYTEDLKDKDGVIEYDIMKVYNDVENSVFNACNGGVSEYKYGVPTWERIEILNNAEKEYLSQVIKPFRKDVVYVTKYQFESDLFENTNVDYQGVCILTKNKNGDCSSVYLPFFEENTMYKGMKLEKPYTLEELEI